MGLFDLFVASSMPVLKVLLITGLGSFIALDHINLLGEDARKHLNNVSSLFYTCKLISPCLKNSEPYALNLSTGLVEKKREIYIKFYQKYV